MLARFLFSWTSFVTRNAKSVLIVLTLCTLAAGYYAISHFHMNSDTGRLIRQDTQWKYVNDKFIETFPQYNQNSFVVVSGNKPDMVRQVTSALTTRLLAHTDIFESVYSPATTEFAERQGLKFLDIDELNDVVSKLADAQPFLTAIATDTSLRSILELVGEAMGQEDTPPAGLRQISDSLNIAGKQALDGIDKPISWRDQLFDLGDGKHHYQVIFVQGKQNFGAQLPNGLIVSTLQSTIDDFQYPFRDSTEIRITGQVPLEHAEIASALDSAQFAGTLALFILVLVLVLGVRSLRIILVTYLSMIVGLVWTAAFAMLVVGQYNTISIIFLVMFIGLGVDFAIHLCLRYQEGLSSSSKETALRQATLEVGPALMLCGITSAVGFLAFVPTEYIGLAEMGVISGGGMIIAVVISLTLIPAVFTVVKPPKLAAAFSGGFGIAEKLKNNPRHVTWFTLAAALVFLVIGSQATFDYSTLALKDPHSEAMSTLKELFDEDIVTDYALSWVAPDLDAATAVKPALLALPTVSKVKTPLDYLPVDQQEKLYLIEDARFLLASVFNPIEETRLLPDEDLQAMLSSLADTITPVDDGTALSKSLTDLKQVLYSLAQGTPVQRTLFTQLILPPLKNEISWLDAALNSESVTIASLPQAMRDRLITNTGEVIVSITPAEDVVPVAAMRRFTEDVLAIVPDATGRPVLDLGIGEIVITAFTTAISIAVLMIFIILLLTLRSFIDSVLVFIPLLMTAMVTLSVSVLIDLPLNMANVVVIPLIFGLGVDNGIHIVKRFHQTDSLEALSRSSTTRAVFLSNLTTLGTFCALSFSTHQGIYSIGVLLTVALASLMILTLTSLPALLATFSRPLAHQRPATKVQKESSLSVYRDSQ